MSAPVTRPTDEDLKYGFCDYATQYYVAARFAARAWLAPVHGNQFHHAVELYLKAALVGTLSIEQMKGRPYSHDIRALWEAFKSKTKKDEAALARFDPTIQALHQFESIRYPDRIAREGAVVAVTWEAAGDVGPVVSTMKMPPRYEVVITVVDQLVIEVLDSTARR